MKAFCSPGVPPGQRRTVPLLQESRGRAKHVAIFKTTGRDARTTIACVFAALICIASSALAANPEPPPDPGFVNSVYASDVIVDCDILAGGPFRAAALVRKVLKGDAPKIIEIEGINSYNWDTVHRGLASGSRFILFLSRTDRADVFATLTPSAPRLSIQADAALLELGDPPFRIPIKSSTMQDAIVLMLKHDPSKAVAGTPETDDVPAFIHALWDETEIESHYLAVALIGALREKRLQQILVDASKDKLLKLQLTAIESLGDVASTEAINTLSVLLKDTKPTISREAARVLVSVKHAETLPDLLEWARRAVAPAHGTTAPKPNKASDATKLKTEAIAHEILRFAAETGPLLDPEAIARPLFDLARCGNDALAREALAAIVEIARPAQIVTLLELAEDRTYDLHSDALSALRKLALKSFPDEAGYRRWWSDVGAGYNDELLRDVVDAAAAGMTAAKDNTEPKDSYDDRRALRDVLRNAPPDMALIAAAPLCFNPDTETEFGADDLAAIPSPLAVPLLIERLGRNSLSERRGAIDGLTKLCFRHPRLRATLWPLLRAELAEEDSTARRGAQAAVGVLAETDGIPALLDSIQIQYSYPRYEAFDAYHAIYNCSARTLGFATIEPMPDEIAAQKRLWGWWESTKKQFAAASYNGVRLPDIAWADTDAAGREAKLEAMALGPVARPSSAAFAMLFAERTATDPLWGRILAKNSARDRAHGLLGLFGGNSAAAAELYRRFPEGSDADAVLCRAISMVGLATLKGPAGAGYAPGTVKLVEWLKGPGAKASIHWKRLGILSLGLADGDAVSLAYLNSVLDLALAVKAPDNKGLFDEKPVEEYQLLKPVLIALAARADGVDGLIKALNESKVIDVRVNAARALSLRRATKAIPDILKSTSSADRGNWTEFARIIAPMLRPSDAPRVCDLLSSDITGARCTAAFMLAARPEIGTDANTIKVLLESLADHSSVVRYYCAEALGKRKTRDAIRALVSLLDDDDGEVRAAAAEALGRIGDKDACRAVIRAASREDRPDIRWLNAMAIAGGDIFFQQFLKLCNSNIFSEQQAGLDAMGVLDRPEALELLLKIFRDDESAMQTQAFDALSRRGTSTVEALREDLKSPDKNIRARALHLLAHTDTRTARDLLIRSSNTDEEAALKTLAEFGLERLRAMQK